MINLFENMALTFSGGGYRASSFGLGVLSYLNKVQFKNKPLLEYVKGLTTVSGGTITGATYAYHKSKRKDFESFYTQFYKILNDDKLLGKALEKLDSDTLWKNTHKKRSLINAFALSYSELFTNGNLKDLKENKSHLEDICFNATDFSFGLSFRFQTTGDFGNYRLKNTNLNLLSDEIKIADAIASSSCFPTGFEPLVMPDDFIQDHDSDTYIALKAQTEFKKGVGIMDGGIVDNQGIGSIMIADSRRQKKGKAFDLIMVCDVGSYFMDPWEQSTINMNKKGLNLSLKQLFNIIAKKINSNWWILALLTISIILLFFGFKNQNKIWLLISGGAAGMATIFALAIKILFNKLEKKALETWDWIMGMIPRFMRDKLKYFENLKLRLIKRMLEERGTSAFTMISDIFMKQIRRLNYNLFYKDDNLKNRRITALIYELTEDQYVHGKSDEKEMVEKHEEIKDPGDRIYASAKIASEMGTTLWFTKKDKDVHRLKNLVACGQYTACYNLLKYCINLKKSEAKVDSKLLNEMTELFQKDWGKFINDPYWLYDKSEKS